MGLHAGAEWGAGSGEWRVGSGEWEVGGGEWGETRERGEGRRESTEYSVLSTEHCCRPLPTSHFPLPLPSASAFACSRACRGRRRDGSSLTAKDSLIAPSTISPPPHRFGPRRDHAIGLTALEARWKAIAAARSGTRGRDPTPLPLFDAAGEWEVEEMRDVESPHSPLPTSQSTLPTPPSFPP